MHMQTVKNHDHKVAPHSAAECGADSCVNL